MYLKNLEIFGFKSFAEKTTVSFGKGVSAIVGPNGSGKSNIVDALRWVLGEQGDKALRSEKRDDVVFSGTRLRKPLSMAEVSLHLVNDDGKLPTEYNEVQIARRFYRSGETEYFLNGTKVRLKDIRSLFVDTGIGPDAYSVIELKMVDNILSSVKNERRKMFEEAAGIISYKQNRDLTFNRLKSVHESLLRVNDIIREKQRNINALERQVKRNEEARVVSQLLQKAELILTDYEFRQLIIEIENIKNHEHENISLKSRLSNEISEFDSKLDELRSELKIRERRLSEISEELDEARNKVESIERENLVLNQQLKSTKDNIERLTKENQNLTSTIEKNSGRITELHEKINMLSETEKVSSSALEEKKTKVQQTHSLILQEKEKLLSYSNSLKELNKDLQLKRSEYDKNKIRLENNFSTLEKLTAQNKDLLENQKLFETDKEVQTEKLEAVKSQIKSKETELNELTSSKQKLLKNILDIEKEITNRTIELERRQSKVQYLTNLIENLEDYAEGIKYLLKDLNEAKIRTVIDSIEVEDKYKAAIETALGEVSNYLILDDSRELSRLMNLLINNKKGKVTFILNDKLHYNNLYIEQFFEEPEFINNKGVYGFADKHIKCLDEKYSLLLKYMLDEYIIVENIETAIKYSSDNFYKFITLDGDIITDSFVRAGSRMNEENIRIGRQKQIESLQQEITSDSKTLSDAANKLDELKAESNLLPVENVSEELDELKSNRAEIENEISKIDFKIQQLTETISRNSSDCKKIESDNVSISSLIDSTLLEINKLDESQSELEKNISSLTSEFNEIELQYSEYNKDYNNFNLEYTKLVNELKYESEELERVKRSIDHQTVLKDKNASDIEIFSATTEEFSQSISENLTKLESLTESRNALSVKLNEEKVIYDEIKEDYTSIDISQRDRRIQFDKVSQLLIDSQIKMKENDIKSEQLRDFIFKKYELHLPLSREKLDELNPEPAEEEFDLFRARKEVDDLNERLKKLGGGYQQFLFDDFNSQKEELEELIRQKEDLLESEKDIRKTIEKINAEARLRFLDTFEKIRNNFIMIFNQLFQEGDEANLRLVYDIDDEGKISEDPLEAKIEIVAKPRGKRPTSIELLSGGEKTLTAIALLFAIYLVKPSPFCVLDEVDAPLDVANLARFNKMIRTFSDKTQFIIITHNERTMEVVDKLYGVTMQESGVTTIVETKFKEQNG